jgi:hypothetical protein
MKRTAVVWAERLQPSVPVAMLMSTEDRADLAALLLAMVAEREALAMYVDDPVLERLSVARRRAEGLAS